MSMTQPTTVAVTGATGYVGARLVPRLLAAGHRVRCLVREPRKLTARPWHGDDRIEVVRCDLADREATAAALAGCTAGVYLVHSMMTAGAEFADADQELARSFAAAAHAAGVGHLVYLGGLGETGGDLSEHLRSRREVEGALRSTPVPVTVLRAAMVLGSGSASFEILRHLVERLPVMITPRWVDTESQPIAIDDVLAFLVAAVQRRDLAGGTFDIGGPDVMTYRQMMQLVAAELGLRRRLIVPVPVLTPRLSSLWIHLVTPIDHRIARPLAEGLRNRMVCRDDRARELRPGATLSVRAAVRAALAAEGAPTAESHWSDAGPMPGDPEWSGGTVLRDRRSLRLDLPPDAAFAAVAQVGGARGWPGGMWLWRLRGAIDRLVGGPGLRRGRRDPDHLAYGDALDFWRVTRVEAGRELELRAEMRLPGVAVLRFEIEPAGEGCRLVQEARFRPRGLAGLLYWYAVWPVHAFVFRRMLHGFGRRARILAQGAGSAPALATARPSPADRC